MENYFTVCVDTNLAGLYLYTCTECFLELPQINCRVGCNCIIQKVFLPKIEQADGETEAIYDVYIRRTLFE